MNDQRSEPHARGATEPVRHEAATFPDGTDAQSLMTLCEELARAAGDHVRARTGDHGGVAATKSSVNDVVTAVDTEVETLLRERIAAARPDDGVLGEEDGVVAGTSGLTWVVDPIDGTVNFLYGIPSYAVSVAVVAGGADPLRWTVLAGCVHAVAGGTTWTAGLGRGAWRDGEPLTVRPAVPLGQALVGTGFGYTVAQRTREAAVVARMLPQVRDIRRIGSAAIDLCLVADGRLDAYYETGLNPWDMAAGSLVVTEAGGTMTGLGGAPASPAMTVAAAPALAAELVAALELVIA
ncbi:inositol monophosphatase family protein [Georgenia subflava]|uniref:Inositol-1-monophosphatase n=1 Tax=Georgenia subflava TaxID=1622177 RepID=A0A6N7EMB1_9MICO|nr:inositol monophosphatase family protein [Georgenia subflava]MPV38571.1 inositol monophosphatase [Georgenia subflava]